MEEGKLVLRKCTKCKTVLTFERFHKDKRNKDGYSTICKSCKRIVQWFGKKKDREIKYDKFIERCKIEADENMKKGRR